MSLSGLSPFRPVRAAWYSVAALSAFVLLMPLAASGQSAAPARPVAVTSGNSGAEAPAAGGRETTAPAAPQARSLHLPFAAQNGNTAESKSLSTRVIGKVKQVTNSINDIVGRVPCLAPKRRVNPVGTLPHVAAKLAAGQPVVIVAFGSSSTEGLARRHRNTPVRTGWRHSCAGIIRPRISPSSTRDTAARLSRK